MSVQMTEGAWYRTREGEKVGPAVFDRSTESIYVWDIGPECYTKEGRMWAGEESPHDLIERIPKPKESDAMKIKPGIWEMRNGDITRQVYQNHGDEWADGNLYWHPQGNFRENKEHPYDLVRHIADAREVDNGDGTVTRVCTLPVTMKKEAWETHEVIAVRSAKVGEETADATEKGGIYKWKGCGSCERLILTPETPEIDPYWPLLADAIDKGECEIPLRYKKIYFHNGNWPCVCLGSDGPSYQWHQSLGDLPIHNDGTPLTIDLAAFRKWHAEREVK